MASRSRLRMLVSVLGVFQGLLRMLMSGQVILLPLLFGSAMGMCGKVMQFSGALVVLVM